MSRRLLSERLSCRGLRVRGFWPCSLFSNHKLLRLMMRGAAPVSSADSQQPANRIGGSQARHTRCSNHGATKFLLPRPINPGCSSRSLVQHLSIEGIAIEHTELLLRAGCLLMTGAYTDSTEVRSDGLTELCVRPQLVKEAPAASPHLRRCSYGPQRSSGTRHM